MLDNGIMTRATPQRAWLLLGTIWERKNRTLQPNAFGVGRM